MRKLTVVTTIGGQPERARNRRGEGGRLREEIVRAASDLLDETGDAAAITLRAVARRAGISAPSIYPHFEDREAMLLAVVQQEFGALHRHLVAAAEGAGADPADRLLAGCRAYLGYARAHPKRYLVMFGGVWNAAPAVAAEVLDRSAVAALGQQSLQELAAGLQDCADTGRSASTDPAADAVALWVGLHGLAHQRIVSTLMTWPADIDERLIRRLTYLN